MQHLAARPYRSRIDVRIAPEPTDDERRLILAALARTDGVRGATDGDSQWRLAALRENVEGDPRNESEPAL